MADSTSTAALNDTAVALVTLMETRNTIAETAVIPISLLGIIANLLALWIWLVDKGPFNPTIFLLKVLIVCEIFLDLTNILNNMKETQWQKAYGGQGRCVTMRLPPFGLLGTLVHVFSQLCVNFTLLLLFVRWLVTHFPLHVQIVMTQIRLYVISGFLLLLGLFQVACVEILSRRNPEKAFSIDVSLAIVNELMPSFAVFLLNCHILWKTVAAKQEEPGDPTSAFALIDQPPPVTVVRKEERGKCCLHLAPPTHPQLRLREGSHPMLELTAVVICIGIASSVLYPVPLIMRLSAWRNLDRNDEQAIIWVLSLRSLHLFWAINSCMCVVFYVIFVTRFRRTLLFILCFCKWPRRAGGAPRETEPNHASAEHEIDLCDCGCGCASWQCWDGCVHHGSYIVAESQNVEEVEEEVEEGSAEGRQDYTAHDCDLQGQAAQNEAAEAWLQQNHDAGCLFDESATKDEKGQELHRQVVCNCNSSSDDAIGGDSCVRDVEQSAEKRRRWRGRRKFTPNQTQTESTGPDYENRGLIRRSSDEYLNKRRQPLHRQELYYGRKSNSDSNVRDDGTKSERQNFTPLIKQAAQLNSVWLDENQSFSGRSSQCESVKERRLPPLHLQELQCSTYTTSDSNVRLYWEKSERPRKSAANRTAQVGSTGQQENHQSRSSDVKEPRQELRCRSYTISDPDEKDGKPEPWEPAGRMVAGMHSNSARLQENPSYGRSSSEKISKRWWQLRHQELHYTISDSSERDGKPDWPETMASLRRICSTRPDNDFSLLFVENRMSERCPSSQKNRTTPRSSDPKNGNEGRRSKPDDTEKSRGFFHHFGSKRNSKRPAHSSRCLRQEKLLSMKRSPRNEKDKPRSSALPKNKPGNGSSFSDAAKDVRMSQSSPGRGIGMTLFARSVSPSRLVVTKEQVGIYETAL